MVSFLTKIANNHYNDFVIYRKKRVRFRTLFLGIKILIINLLKQIIQSQLISVKKYPIIYGRVQLNIEDKPTGLYIAKIHLETPVTLKILKQ